MCLWRPLLLSHAPPSLSLAPAQASNVTLPALRHAGSVLLQSAGAFYDFSSLATVTGDLAIPEEVVTGEMGDYDDTFVSLPALASVGALDHIFILLRPG